MTTSARFRRQRLRVEGMCSYWYIWFIAGGVSGAVLAIIAFLSFMRAMSKG
jgi:hypothetical protein